MGIEAFAIALVQSLLLSFTQKMTDGKIKRILAERIIGKTEDRIIEYISNKGLEGAFSSLEIVTALENCIVESLEEIIACATSAGDRSEKLKTSLIKTINSKCNVTLEEDRQAVAEVVKVLIEAFYDALLESEVYKTALENISTANDIIETFQRIISETAESGLFRIEANLEEIRAGLKSLREQQSLALGILKAQIEKLPSSVAVNQPQHSSKIEVYSNNLTVFLSGEIDVTDAESMQTLGALGRKFSSALVPLGFTFIGDGTAATSISGENGEFLPLCTNGQNYPFAVINIMAYKRKAKSRTVMSASESNIAVFDLFVEKGLFVSGSVLNVDTVLDDYMMIPSEAGGFRQIKDSSYKWVKNGLAPSIFLPWNCPNENSMENSIRFLVETLKNMYSHDYRLRRIINIKQFETSFDPAIHLNIPSPRNKDEKDRVSMLRVAIYLEDREDTMTVDSLYRSGFHHTMTFENFLRKLKKLITCGFINLCDS
jgi:hypothetical protein